MENRYLIDTNVVIDYMSDLFPREILLELDRIFSESYAISVINKIELLGFVHIPDEKEQKLHRIVQDSNLVYLHDGIVEETISIRKKIKIKLPDAIIAASALTLDVTLITSNTRDFKKIPNLKVLNPVELI